MLLAVLNDMRRLHGIAVTVALTDELRDTDWVDQLVANGVSCTWIRTPLVPSLPTLAANFDMVLPIAPEIDGTLVNVVRKLSDTSALVLTPELETVEQCSDKLRTFQVLRNHGIPTVPTHRAEGFAALNVPELVLKPRFGAGCDGILRCSPADLTLWKTGAKNPGDFIVQPWLQGVALSIAVIGCGPAHPALVLPLAEQSLSWRQSRPEYTGGIVPALVDPSVHAQAAALARKLAAALALTRGYLGIDLLRLNDGSLTVVEVNPRLCTSYIGYQAAIPDNLTEWLLLQRTDSLKGTVRTVRFLSSGEVTS